MQEDQEAFTYQDLLEDLEAWKVLHALDTNGVFHFLKRVYIFTESYNFDVTRMYVHGEIQAWLRG